MSSFRTMIFTKQSLEISTAPNDFLHYLSSSPKVRLVSMISCMLDSKCTSMQYIFWHGHPMALFQALVTVQVLITFSTLPATFWECFSSVSLFANKIVVSSYNLYIGSCLIRFHYTWRMLHLKADHSELGHWTRNDPSLHPSDSIKRT